MTSVLFDQGAAGAQAWPIKSQGLMPVRQWAHFYNLRGQRFISTTGYVTTVPLNADAELAAVRNPSDSGVWVFFDLLEFGAIGATGRFTRYSGGTFDVTGSPKPTAKTNGDTGSAKLEIFTSDAFSVTGGTARKVAPMADARPYFVEAHGSLILRPGQYTHWNTNEVPGGGNGTYTAYINFEWVEIPTENAEALSAAMSSYQEY